MVICMGNKLFSKNYIFTVLSATLFYIATFMLNSVCGRYTIEIGGTKSVAGVVTAVFTLSSFFTRAVWGYITDAKGRKRVYITGGILCLVSAVVLLFSDKIWLLIVSRFIFGTGYSALTTAGGTIVCDVAPQNLLPKAISFYGITNVLSQAVAPAAALWLYNISFSRLSWSVIVVVALVLLFSVFINYNEKHFIMPETKFRIYEKTAMPAAYVIFFFAVATASVYSFIPVMARERNIQHPGVFFIVSASGLLISRIFNTKFCEKYGSVKVFTAGNILFICGFIRIAFIKNIWLLSFAALIYGVGAGFVHPVVNTAAVKRCSPEKRGLATGTFMMSQDLGMTAGAVIWGTISEKTDFTVMYCAVTLTAIFMYIVFRKILAKALD